MEMLRWLATNKVLQVTWGLGILTMVMSSVFGGGSSDAKHEPAAKAEVAAVEQTAEVKAAAPEVATEASVPAVQALVATEVASEAVATEAKSVEAVADTDVVESTEAVVTETAESVVEVTEASTEATEATVVEAEEVVAEAAAVETVAEEAAVETEAAVEAETVAEVEAAVEPAEVVAATTEEAATEAVSDVVEATSAADTSGFADKSSADLLVMAREAYWNNGLEESGEIYKVLIEREPEVIEHKGELGNVFWRQGYPKQAAELYAEIAAPMIEKGNAERVSNMVGFIGLFFPERATEIRALLDAQ